MAPEIVELLHGSCSSFTLPGVGQQEVRFGRPSDAEEGTPAESHCKKAETVNLRSNFETLGEADL
jgi:hypothetical protein